MSVSSTSSTHSRTRPVAETLSSNYSGKNPLQTNPTRGDAIVKKDRPNIPSQDENPLADQSITNASTHIRGYLPPDQGGTIPLKEINSPVKKGYSRASVFNLLVAGNQNNLDRQNRAILGQEKKNLGNLVDKQQAGL